MRQNAIVYNALPGVVAAVHRSPRPVVTRRRRLESAFMHTVMIVLGTRPEATKLRPLPLELHARPGFRVVVCATAQHRHMPDQVLSVFRVVPEYGLDIMPPAQSQTTL